MNFRRLLFLSISLLSVQLATGQIEFNHDKWADLLALAEKDNKIIFVDAYAEWCGPCKMMDRQVFSTTEVGDVFNKNFINAKIDMEKGEGPQLRGMFGVTAYPTLLFVNSSGKVLHKVVGYQTPDKLIQNAELALRKVNQFKEYKEKYDAGERDPGFVLTYIEEMIKAEKPTEKFTNDYLREQKSIDESLKTKIAYTGLESLDSHLYGIIKDKKDFLDQAYGHEAVVEKVYKAASASIETAAMYEEAKIFDQTIKNVLDFGLNPAFGRKLELQYYGTLKDESSYLKTLNEHIKKDGPNVSILSFETFRAFVESPNMRDYSKQIFITDYTENTTLQNYVIGLNLAIGSKDEDFLEKVYQMIQAKDGQNDQDKMRITQFYQKAKQMI